MLDVIGAIDQEIARLEEAKKVLLRTDNVSEPARPRGRSRSRAVNNKVMALLKKSNTPVPINAIREALGINGKTASNAVYNLKRQKLIRLTAKGYKLV